MFGGASGDKPRPYKFRTIAWAGLVPARTM